MEPKTQRLMAKGLPEAVATALVAGGYDNPAKIRRATDRELEALPGIGKATRQEIRRVIG